jgi:hypothetical protein
MTSNEMTDRLYTYAVGKPYNSVVSGWAENAAEWRLSEDGVQLVLFMADPTAEEVEAVRNGRSKFALTTGEHALILAYRFATQPWSDAPWQACRQTDLTAGLVAVPSGQHLRLMVILVDSATGIVRAVRMTSWNAEFTAAVRSAIGKQLRNRSTDGQGAAEIRAWYHRYPTTKKLVEHADIVR